MGHCLVLVFVRDVEAGVFGQLDDTFCDTLDSPSRASYPARTERTPAAGP